MSETNRAERNGASDGESITSIPVEDMLHGVAAQTATMMSLRELMIAKNVITPAEWQETFARNHERETTRIREILDAQRVT